MFTSNYSLINTTYMTYIMYMTIGVLIILLLVKLKRLEKQIEEHNNKIINLSFLTKYNIKNIDHILKIQDEIIKIYKR